MGHAQIPGSIDGTTGTIAIDDGTSGRIESPDPGPVGFDATRGGGHTSAGAGIRVLGFARRHRGGRVGNGECFTLADKALSGAGALSAGDYGTVTPDADYVWGTAVDLADLQPGDVIQFRDYRYDREVSTTNPDGSGSDASDFQERPHHTAIVDTVDGNGAVTVLEQNAPAGSAVRRSHLFFTPGRTTSGRTTTTIRVQGTVWFYRAQAR